MLDIPKRKSLVTETASILRKAIAGGTWEEHLPGERSLCQQFQISRPTLRSALSLLEKEGWVATTRGKRRRLSRPNQKGKDRTGKVIGIITNRPISFFSQFTLHLIMEMRYSLIGVGFDSEIYFPSLSDDLDFQHQRRKVENFILKNDLGCCILAFSSEEQQQWFQESEIPSLVLGSTYPSVALPCLDIDQFAACRHAAGIFLARGHRRLVLIRNDNRVAGDRASAEGFLEGIDQSTHGDAAGTVVRHKGDHQDLVRKLDPLFLKADDTPTGILVCRPMETLMVMNYLLKRGFSIPEDVSIIARDWDYSFEALDPRLAHYVFPREVFSRRLVRLVLQLLDTGAIPTKKHLILSEFREESSLRDLR